MKKKISFSELSVPLKTAVIFAWILGSIWSVLFLIGFMEGMFSAI